MRPKTITYTLGAPDADGLASDDLSGAGRSFTLDGALASGGTVTLDSPRHINVTSANNDAAITFTVTGTDRRGAALTETITGVNASTVSGVENFATVTAVTASGATVGVVTVGSGNSAETQWIPVEYRISSGYNTSVVFSTGTMTYSVKGTLDNPWGSSFNETTADTVGVGSSPVRAIRCECSAIDATSGCVFTLTIVHN